MRRERLDLRTLVDIAVETSQPLIDAARHRLTVMLPSPAPVLEGDAVRLVQVFASLICNAAKFTGDAGQIWVTARPGDDRVVISIRDTGPGMSAQTLETIFGLPLEDRDPAGTPRDGRGIGLALVRQTVELHGGLIEARSDDDGQGSELLVTLPVVSAHAEHGRAAGAVTQPSLAGHRVLIVDDHQDGADSLGMMLDILGATTAVVYDGAAAIERIAQFRPGVVFLDIGMPRMDGYEVARRIREHPEHRDVALIALTGWSQAEDRRRGVQAGFDFHLVKPLDMDTLRTVMASLELLRGGHERRLPAGGLDARQDDPSGSRRP